ncbi:MAG: hypothetical protein RI897_2301 [Verrucomicrobiota bacterium]|jgi:hypothetical protein
MVRFIVLLILVFGVVGVRAGDVEPDALGVRVGVSASSLDALYSQTDVALRWELAETDRMEHERWLGLELDLSVGALAGRGEVALAAGVGPVLLIGKGRCPLTAEVGLSPTYISRDHFDADDYGSQFQFTTRGGLGYRLSDRLRLVYCLQHMSNAELATPNPGLNLHTLTLFFRL